MKASRKHKSHQSMQSLDVHLNGDNEQPITCSKCGSRTDFEDVDNNSQHHKCLNVRCNYEFILNFKP